MFQYKVAQYDISRGRIPKPETVARRLALLKPFGLTHLQLYIECVVETSVFPAVGCGRTPVTADYLRQLVRLGADYGVRVIPLFQVLAHQDRLLALDEFQELGELPPPLNRRRPNNFLPGSARTRERVSAWLEELIPLFDGPFVHVGCDEAWSVGAGRSRELAEQRGLAPLLAEYLGEIRKTIVRHGKRMMMYADPAIFWPEILPLLPSDIVLVNWHYGIPGDAYEQDNRHFEAHPRLFAQGHEIWSSGNNMAEYVMTPFHRFEKNVDTWLGLARLHPSPGFVIGDWGSNANINPHLLSILGDQYALMRLANESLTLDTFLEAFSTLVLGAADTAFMDAWRRMVLAQNNPGYIDPRLISFCCCFGSMYLDDPATSPFGRLIGCCRKEGLTQLLGDMRIARARLSDVRVRTSAHPDFLDDSRHLADRLIAMALRALLWHDIVWDTGYPAPLRQRDDRRAAWLTEYLERADADIEWYGEEWRRDNLESDRESCLLAMKRARDSIRCAVSGQATA
ncbi:MAG: family 20 glycosylhydrolase [Kiritimatiellae bacterium]|nr:family 20 glycosylhydrolase [Kiritimatiellia bacterium]